MLKATNTSVHRKREIYVTFIVKVRPSKISEISIRRTKTGSFQKCRAKFWKILDFKYEISSNLRHQRYFILKDSEKDDGKETWTETGSAQVYWHSGNYMQQGHIQT